MEVDMSPVYELLQEAIHHTEEFRSSCQMSMTPDHRGAARPHLTGLVRSIRHSAIDLHMSLGFLIGVLENLEKSNRKANSNVRENEGTKQLVMNQPPTTTRPTTHVTDRCLAALTSKIPSVQATNPYASAPNKTASAQVTERYASAPTPTPMFTPSTSHLSVKQNSSSVVFKEGPKEQKKENEERIILPSFPSLCSSLSNTFPTTPSTAPPLHQVKGPAPSSPSERPGSSSNSPRQMQSSSWSWAPSSSSEHTPTRIAASTSLLHLSPSWPPATSTSHSYTSSSLTHIKSPMTHSAMIPSLPQGLTNPLPVCMTSTNQNIPWSLTKFTDDDCQEIIMTEDDKPCVNMARKRIFRKINSMIMCKKKKLEENLICTNCGSTSTPQWRKGPDGKSSLCNACGIHYASQKKKILTRYRK